MFIEPIYRDESANFSHDRGWIEVIVGSMFSGKTEELIRRLQRARIARQKVEIFKPAIDTRYAVRDIVSHNERSIRSTPVQIADDILLQGSSSDVIGIDEVQFFDKNIIEVTRKLANMGKRVIVAGLDMDYQGRPFYPVTDLMAMAEFVTKMHAICMSCGNLATYSFRKSDNDKQVLLGESDIYEARCRRCFNDGMNFKKSQKKDQTHEH